MDIEPTNARTAYLETKIKLEAHEMWEACKGMGKRNLKQVVLTFDEDSGAEEYWINNAMTREVEHGPYTLPELHAKLVEITGGV